MDKQVRYNFKRSEEDSCANTWWFLIVNDNRGIELAQKRIYSSMAEIYNEKANLEGNYPKTGLRYKLLNFDSRRIPDREILKRIYKKIIQDPKLYDRKNSGALEEYVFNLNK